MSVEGEWRGRVRGRSCRDFGWCLGGEGDEGRPFASAVLPAVGKGPGRYCVQTLTTAGLVYACYPVMVAAP